MKIKAKEQLIKKVSNWFFIAYIVTIVAVPTVALAAGRGTFSAWWEGTVGLAMTGIMVIGTIVASRHEDKQNPSNLIAGIQQGAPTRSYFLNRIYRNLR